MTKITTDAQPLLSPTELEIARIIQLGFNKWPRTGAVEMAKEIAARLASTSPAPDGFVPEGWIIERVSDDTIRAMKPGDILVAAKEGGAYRGNLAEYALYALVSDILAFPRHVCQPVR